MTRQRDVAHEEQHRQLPQLPQLPQWADDRGLRAEFNTQGLTPGSPSSVRCREHVLDGIEQAHRLVVVAAHRPVRAIVALTGFESRNSIVCRFVLEVIDAKLRVTKTIYSTDLS